MAHEAGIKAAWEAVDSVDWVEALLGSGYGSGSEVFEEMLKAYLSASGMVLVPKDPNHDMRLAALSSPLPSIQDNRPLYEICWGRMLDAAPDPFKSKP